MAKKNIQIAAGEICKTGPFAKSWRIATQTLAEMEEKLLAEEYDPMRAWGDWFGQSGFPEGEGTTAADRYVFIDQYLQKLLAPQKHPTHPTKIRPDMNGKHGGKRAWVLNRILSELVGSLEKFSQNPDYSPTSSRFKVEDLPKVVEDIYLLHKHHDKLEGEARTLQYYKSLEDLSRAVKPWRPKYPISYAEREAANYKFLQAHGGNGEAELIATLPDGSELIQVKSEAASRAYGSPRWCTAYRNESTYFKNYKDNLLIFINPEGERWQFHFRTQQFRDADDASIKKFPIFLNEHAGLAKTLAPFVEYYFISAPSELRAASSTLAFCKDVKEWMAIVPVDLIPHWLVMAGQAGQGREVSAILAVCKDVEEWRAVVPVDQLSDWLVAAGKVGQGGGVSLLLNACKNSEEWRTALTHWSVVAAFATLLKKGYLGVIPEFLKTVSQVEEWRAALTQSQSIPAAFAAATKAGKWKAVRNILFATKDIPEWRETMENMHNLPRKLRRLFHRNGLIMKGFGARVPENPLTLEVRHILQRSLKQQQAPML